MFFASAMVPVPVSVHSRIAAKDQRFALTKLLDKWEFLQMGGFIWGSLYQGAYSSGSILGAPDFLESPK